LFYDLSNEGLLARNGVRNREVGPSPQMQSRDPEDRAAVMPGLQAAVDRST
jgi:hypothetical protein